MSAARRLMHRITCGWWLNLPCDCDIDNPWPPRAAGDPE